MMNIDTQTVEEMLAALKANIEYLSQMGSAQVRVRNGRLMQTVGDKFVYQFDLEFLQNIEADAEVEIRISNTTASGKIAALSENNVQIEVDKNLGDKVSEAVLVISSYYLLELLQKRLEMVLTGEIKLSELAAQVFDKADFPVSIAESYIPRANKDPLNSYQLEAVRLALGNPVSFIWGPPGTGKTQTIASIIEGYISENKSVLLLSHTNKATDEALNKTIKHLGKENNDYQDGKLIRFGEITLDELKDKFVTPEAIAEKNGRAIRGEIRRIGEEIITLNKQISEAASVLKDYEAYMNCQREIDNIKEYVVNQQSTAKGYKDEVERLKQHAVNLKEELAAFDSKGSFSRIFTSRKPPVIESERANIIKLIYKRDDQINEIKANLQEAKGRYATVSVELGKLRERMPKKDIEFYQNISENGGVKILKLLEEQGQLEKQLEELRDNLVLEAKVVATTLTKSYTSKTVLSREYDCVIIDEASMAPLPAVLCACGLAQKNVVIVGDFLQLPPVTKHKVIRTRTKSEAAAKEEERLVHDWLMRDIFAVAGVENGIRKDKAPHKLRQLKRQYRMHSAIADVINEIAYGKFGKDFALESDTISTDNRFDSLVDTEPSKGARIAFYDTSERAPIASQLDGGSYYNLYNALVCVELAAQAIESGYENVGIISAYRAQVNLIQKMVADRFGKTKQVDADTVHRFQGGEKELIIFDITTANSPSMYDDGDDEGNDMKLLNVALSRSREKCVLVGDMKQIVKAHSPSSLVRKIIMHIAEHHYPVYNTEELLDGFRVNAQTDELLKKFASSPGADSDMGKSELFDERDFYGQFIKDVLSAEKEIIIDSPYMTTRRVDELYKYLEQAVHKGVKIYVLTRIPKEQDGRMQYYSETEIDRLSKLGIKVLPFIGKIHRKIAIIDREILWEGSLNILSQRDSREIMRRFDGAGSAQQMMTFLKLDKNLGAIGSDSLRHCEFCDSPVAWYWTDSSVYGGLWTSCLLNRHKEGVPPKSKAQLQASKDNLRQARKAKKEKSDDGSPICPNHQLVMVKRTGRFGEFYGCPRYPACKITERIR